MRRARWLLVVAVVLAAACSRGGAEADPDALAPMPVARTEVAGAAWRGGIAVVGGLTQDGKASARADLYDVAANRWRRLPALPVALHHTTAVALGERLYVIGGYTIEGAQWRESARVWSLGGDDRWRDEAPLPAARGAHAAAALGGRIVVVGGVSEGRVAASSAAFEPGKGWRAGPPMQRPREHLAATVVGPRVYAIAGRADGVNFTDVESWDGSAAHWWNEPPLNDSRGGIGAATVGGAACVAGGEEAEGTIASVECLRGGAWARVGALDAPRHGLAVVAIGSRLHVIGGGERPGLFVSSVHEALPL